MVEPGDGWGANGEAVLVAAGVRKTYDADTAPVRALRGVDLRLDAGEFVALTGPSGSGKSTLLQLAAGLDRADDGTVLLAGYDLAEADERELALLRRRHVGIVFQFFHLVEGMTALENVLLAALLGRRGRRGADTRAREVLDLVGLLDKATAWPASLSGGQRQRLAIARALANRPTLLLADEPTGALDSDGEAAMLDLFARLHAAGQTILVVTHSPTVAARAGRVVQLRDGAVVAPVATAP